MQVRTDAGNAFVKVLENPVGPHALACEWVGTGVARLLGLPTFDVAILFLTEADGVPAPSGMFAKGPAFVARAERGTDWGGDGLSLTQLANKSDLVSLVLCDTLLLNRDRHPPAGVDRRPNYGNVFLSQECFPANSRILKAMDFSDCLTAGRPLNRRIADIGNTQDDRIYGLFPEFGKYIDRQAAADAAEKARVLTRESVSALVESLPGEWEVAAEVRAAMTEFVVGRAEYLTDHFVGMLFRKGMLPSAPET